MRPDSFLPWHTAKRTVACPPNEQNGRAREDPAPGQPFLRKQIGEIISNLKLMQQTVSFPFNRKNIGDVFNPLVPSVACTQCAY